MNRRNEDDDGKSQGAYSCVNLWLRWSCIDTGWDEFTSNKVNHSRLFSFVWFLPGSADLEKTRSHDLWLLATVQYAWATEKRSRNLFVVHGLFQTSWNLLTTVCVGEQYNDFSYKYENMGNLNFHHLVPFLGFNGDSEHAAWYVSELSFWCLVVSEVRS